MLGLAFRFLQQQVFKNLLYAETWEDFAVDKQALQLQPKDTVLCITSGGSFALNAALSRPKAILSIDKNQVQSHILELKQAAIRTLDFETFWQFQTQASVANKLAYRKLRLSLRPQAQSFFDQNPRIIRSGILNNGMLHSALGVLHTYIAGVCGKALLHRLINAESLEQQANIYKTRIEKRIWNAISKNLPVSTMLFYGVSPEQIRFIQQQGVRTLQQLYKRQFDAIFTTIPLTDNFYWAYILTKHYSREAAPNYLQEHNYAKLQKSTDRIQNITSEALAFLQRQEQGSISKFNFSDIIDWNPTTANKILAEAARTGKQGAIVTFRSELPQFEMKDTRLRHDTQSPRLAIRERTGSYAGYFKYVLRK